MIFKVELSPGEWDGLIALAEQAARYPADELRTLLRQELEKEGLLVQPDDPEGREEA
jgi:hypothetical protein